MGHIHEAEARRRIESMSCEDILELSTGAIDRLLCVSYVGYVELYPEKIVRLMVSRGKDKREKERIFSRVKDAYKSFWPYNFASFDSDDYDCDAAWYFSGIEFDISTNFPLLPDEEENADDNSPLPNPNSSPSGEDGRRLSELNSRIAELEEENEALKEQVEHFRNMEKGTALGLNQAQAALFGLSLANTFEFQYTNKKKQLAPLLHKLFGWGQTKLKTCLSTPCEKEERDELANLFKELCPPLYDTIMKWGELPQ